MAMEWRSDATAVHESPDWGEATLLSLFGCEGRDGSMPELVVIGDTGIDFFVAVGAMPGRDAKVIGKHLGVFGGGMGANFATAAKVASPDLHVRLASRLGFDDWGARTLRDLVGAGVDTSAVVTDPESATWWCAVGLDTTGEKSLLGGRTPASLPTTHDFRPDDWRGASWLHILGDVPWSHEAVFAAKERGLLTSVDVEGSFTREFPDRARDLVRAADLSILNLPGVEGLGSPGQELGATVEELTGGAVGPRRPTALLVTMGADGALFVHRSPGQDWRFCWCPALRRRVVDSTGAGDAFAGTFVALLLNGSPVRECMAEATAAGARAVVRVGSRGSRLDQHQEGKNS